MLRFVTVPHPNPAEFFGSKRPTACLIRPKGHVPFSKNLPLSQLPNPIQKLLGDKGLLEKPVRLSRIRGEV